MNYVPARPSSGRLALFLQGLYYLVTGLWPLIHVESFMKVTGPKRDIWLVKTIGLLICATSLSMLRSAVKDRQPSQDAAVTAVASAAVLAGCDVYYVAKRTIRPVYLLDAVAEVAFIAWLLRSLRMCAQSGDDQD